MPSIWRLDLFDWKAFGKHIWKVSGRMMGQSARLSFYFVFALFPFLLFLTAALGLLLEKQSILRESLQSHLYTIAPRSIVTLLNTVLEEVTKGSSGGKLTFGLLFSLWAASTGMSALMEALNMAYQVEEARRWWKKRLEALALTVGFTLLSLLALAILFYAPRVLENAGGYWSVGRVLWVVLQWVVLMAFLLMAFNILYVFGPNVKHREWRWVMPGTVAGVLLWIAISFGLKVYLSFFNRFSATYGSIGGVMILLLWLYLSGFAIMLGGELNSALEQRDGKLKAKEKRDSG